MPKQEAGVGATCPSGLNGHSGAFSPLGWLPRAWDHRELVSGEAGDPAHPQPGDRVVEREAPRTSWSFCWLLRAGQGHGALEHPYVDPTRSPWEAPSEEEEQGLLGCQHCPVWPIQQVLGHWL